MFRLIGFMNNPITVGFRAWEAALCSPAASSCDLQISRKHLYPGTGDHWEMPNCARMPKASHLPKLRGLEAARCPRKLPVFCTTLAMRSTYFAADTHTE